MVRRYSILELTAMRITLYTPAPSRFTGPQLDAHVWTWLYTHVAREAPDESFLLRAARVLWLDLP